MQDILLGTFLGLSAGLLTLTFRNKHKALGTYWLTVSVAVLASMWGWTRIGLMLFVLCAGALQYHVAYHFRVRFSFRRFLSPNFPLLLMLIAAMIWPAWSAYLLVGAFTWGIGVLVLMMQRQYRLRGISVFGGIGPRIFWIHMAIIHLLFSMAFATWVGTGPALVAMAVLWATYSLWHFSAEGSFALFDAPAKYSKSTMDVKEKARLVEALDAIIDSRDYFLESDSSLQGLARQLHTTPHRLSQLINEEKGKTFFELQAQVRIQQARLLLADEQYAHLKIEEIGNQVGYASKSSFNTTFKKITGRTPSAYRAREVRPYKVERPMDRDERDSLGLLDTFEWIQNSSVMFTNFFKVFFRTQLRNKLFSSINLVGLVIGLCSTLLIFVYLQHEMSYDQFHARSQDIYRLIWRSDNPQTRTPHPAAQALVRDFPQVEAGVSFTPNYGPGLTLQSIYVRNPLNNRMFREADTYSADSTFFQVFDFDLIAGDRTTVLDQPGEVVISASIARKYFGDEDPLGKVLDFVEYGFSGVISGVMADAPANSHFHPQILVSYMSRKAMEPDNEWWTWADFGHFNYIKLQPGTDAKALEAALIEWLPQYVDWGEDGLADLRARRHYLELQPITDIHLRSNVRWELEANGSIIFVRILIAAIIFLIIIASINFINLSTARAFERGKEVGIRRSLGAQKLGISAQFLLESVVTTLLALAVAFGLAFLVFGEFAHLAGLSLSSSVLVDPWIIILAIAVAVSIGLATGIYPAIVVTSQKPVEILKGKFTSQVRGGAFRKGLLFIQFGVSAVMIFGSLIVLQQVHFIESKDLGFTTDQLLVMEVHDQEEMRRLPAMKSEVLKIPGVLGAAGISNLPGTQFNQNPVFAESNAQQVVSFAELRLDFGTLELLGLELTDGRWLNRSMGQDSTGTNFIVNEAAIQQLNLEDPFNESIRWVTEGEGFQGKIVGVIEDFHFKSLHKDIQPLIMQIEPRQMNYLLVKIAPGVNVTQIIAELERVHAIFDDDLDLDYYFLDGLIDDQYQAEQRALRIFNIFTGLALAMAALGLLGMAFLVITQRTKEIGIRKVVGARSIDIWWHEITPFLWIILSALAIGLPASYWIMDSWLQGFAYRTAVSWEPFVTSVVVLLAVAVVSVSAAVLRTILRDPSKSLRYE